jgi:hypothetical protein
MYITILGQIYAATYIGPVRHVSAVVNLSIHFFIYISGLSQNEDHTTG